MVSPSARVRESAESYEVRRLCKSRLAGHGLGYCSQAPGWAAAGFANVIKTTALSETRRDIRGGFSISAVGTGISGRKTHE